jgi:hypothetical protein
MPPRFTIPSSISKGFVFVGFAGTAAVSLGLVALRVHHGGPLRFKMLPDGSIALMTRAEALERRLAQAQRRAQENPDSQVYRDMVTMYERMLSIELEKHPPPVELSDDDLR